ncbi:MAG: hypothetical protein PHV62_03215 [Sulfuricurvum sp.]|nr:hypothetical protein [Sulfuricurvum sp.]
MSQTRKQQAIFPDLPRDKQVVDRNGEITPAWDLFFQQLVMALQTNFKPEGIVVPPQSATNLADLGNTSGSIGNIIYDSTNNAFKGIILVSIGPPIVTATKTFTIT